MGFSPGLADSNLLHVLTYSSLCALLCPDLLLIEGKERGGGQLTLNRSALESEQKVIEKVG
jgi:hypothetical protein